jgi:hypothetical protein
MRCAPCSPRIRNADVDKLYEPFAIDDIQLAADVLRQVYDCDRR